MERVELPESATHREQDLAAVGHPARFPGTDPRCQLYRFALWNHPGRHRQSIEAAAERRRVAQENHRSAVRRDRRIAIGGEAGCVCELSFCAGVHRDREQGVRFVLPQGIGDKHTAGIVAPRDRGWLVRRQQRLDVGELLFRSAEWCGQQKLAVTRACAAPQERDRLAIGRPARAVIVARVCRHPVRATGTHLVDVEIGIVLLLPGPREHDVIPVGRQGRRTDDALQRGQRQRARWVGGGHVAPRQGTEIQQRCGQHQRHDHQSP